MKILVLGGKGFIGRHAVAALREKVPDVAVVIGTRNPSPSKSGITEIATLLEQMGSIDAWRGIAAEYDVILNCVGILRPSGTATYNRIHHLAPQAIAAACAEAGKRFVHVSALGLDGQNRSGFLRSKLDGENAIKATTADWIIARPSLLDGEGGYGAAWLRGVARLPIFATPADALGGIAALTVTDLGEALALLSTAEPADLDLASSRVFELGGLTAYRFENYIRGLRLRHSTTRAISVPLPGIIARLGAHICDVFRLTPFSFGHWELLRKDNVPTHNRLPELLGRTPTEVIPASLAAEFAIDAEFG